MSKDREQGLARTDSHDQASRTKKAWSTPAIVEQDLLETVAGACGNGAKTPAQSCENQSLT